MKKEDVVIITGAAQRLGLYNARQLTKDGYQVAITYRTPRDYIQDLEREGIIAIQADFSSEAGIDAFINTALDSFTSLRAIVHNASIWETDEAIFSGKTSFMEIINVQMHAPFKINHALHPLLLASRSAMKDIVHMTDYSVRKGSKFHAAYCAAKAGRENMALSFAALFGPQIKVNCIAPALVKFNTWDSEEYRKAAEKKSIMGFEPGEAVAYQALSYLFNNPYVTGTTLHLDGGRHLV